MEKLETATSHINWQPLVDALARFIDIVSSWASGSLSGVLLVIVLAVLLWGRDRTASWLEALGWNGIVNAISSVWSARGVTVNTTKEANFNVPLLPSPTEHSADLERALALVSNSNTDHLNNSQPSNITKVP